MSEVDELREQLEQAERDAEGATRRAAEAQADHAKTRAALLQAREALRMLATTGVRTNAEVKEIAGRGYAASHGEAT